MRNRNLLLVVTALASVLLQGCEQPALTTIPQDSSILAYGDSLTLGVGAGEANSYPTVLAELSGRRVINAGVSGETTAGGMARLPETLADTNPALLILLEGGNDILRNENPATTKRNLAAMIEMAKSRGVQIVLIGVPERSLFSDVAPFYRDLAQEYELVLEDELIGDLLRTPRYKSDAIHFNQHGYRVMAEAIFELLAEMARCELSGARRARALGTALEA